MLSLILFPLIVFLIFNLVFIRGFSRSTGLRVLPTRIFIYFFAGAALTLITYLILLFFEQIFGTWYDAIRVFTTPILEDLLKILLLSLLTSRIYIVGEELQLYRQRLLSGILLGLIFGLVETYLYSFVQTESRSFLLGSIPLQMVIGGSIGIALSGKNKPFPQKVSFLLIITGHLLYNQSLTLPGPIANVALFILLLASFILINLLYKPRNPSEDS